MSNVTIAVEDALINAPGKIVKTVKISGQLDETNVDENAKKIYDLISANEEGLNIIFDFEELEYMNSKSVGYLTDWYSKVTEKKGQIFICKAKDNILDILNVVGLSKIIPIFATIDEAKAVIVPVAPPAPSSPINPPSLPAAPSA